MFDKFRNHDLGPTAPAIGAIVITPSNDTDLPNAVRAITIGSTGGTLSYIGRDGQAYTTAALPLGTYPLFAHRILATGTTAAGLTGWI